MVVGRTDTRIGAAIRADYPPAVERRWTDPGYAPAQADVVVIGGGIIGSAAAAIMADRGAAVVLVEETAIGAGASGRNLGAIQHPFDPVLGRPLRREPRPATARSRASPATGSRSATSRLGCSC